MQAIFCRIGSMRTIVRFQNWPWRLLSGLCQHRIRERRVGGCDLVRGPAMRTPNGKFESTKPRQRRLVSPDCRPNRAATVRALVRQHAFFLVHHGQPPRYYNWSCIRITVPEEVQDALKAYPRYSQAMFKKSLANLFLAHCRLSGLADDGAFTPL